jgi:hypothetical protein
VFVGGAQELLESVGDGAKGINTKNKERLITHEKSDTNRRSPAYYSIKFKTGKTL